MSAHRRRRHGASALAGVVAAAVALLALAGGLLDRFEGDSIDARFGLRGDQPVKGIAVVGIDEDTLSGKVTWPMDRKLHAKMVDRLAELGAGLIVYDVQFT